MSFGKSMATLSYKIAIKRLHDMSCRTKRDIFINAVQDFSLALEMTINLVQHGITPNIENQRCGRPAFLELKGASAAIYPFTCPLNSDTFKSITFHTPGNK
jgi:hypothetical protein